MPLTILNDFDLSDHDILQLKKFIQIDFFTGNAVLEKLNCFEVVVKTPGISSYRNEVKEAKNNRVYFTSSTRLWFAEHGNEKTICITGTNGKSTTASLVAHLLSSAGLKATLCGNIGVPLLDLFDVAQPPDVWVIELSSYQTSDFEGSPSVGILLNLFPEHLDWHGDIQTYYKDKLQLFSGIKDGKTILNRLDETVANIPFEWHNPIYFNDPDAIHVENGYICNKKIKMLPTKSVKLQGVHNLSNICAALTAVQSIGINLEDCIESIQDFHALPHRLTLLGESNDVKYVDDSISTTPQSAIAAAEVFLDCPVTILLGGQDRGLDWELLAKYLVEKRFYAVVTMPESGPKIQEKIKSFKESMKSDAPILYEASNLNEAVVVAKQITPRGGVVLLSPASPSYGIFKNYEERGDTFAQAAGFNIAAFN